MPAELSPPASGLLLNDAVVERTAIHDPISLQFPKGRLYPAVPPGQMLIVARVVQVKDPLPGLSDFHFHVLWPFPGRDARAAQPIFHPVESADVGLVGRDVKAVEDAIAPQVEIGKQDLFVRDVNRKKYFLATFARRCRAGPTWFFMAPLLLPRPDGEADVGCGRRTDTTAHLFRKPIVICQEQVFRIFAFT